MNFETEWRLWWGRLKIDMKAQNRKNIIRNCSQSSSYLYTEAPIFAVVNNEIG